MGLFTPQSRTIFSQEEVDAFNAYKEHSSSKKSDQVRRVELLKMVLKPMETFFEEHIQFYLLDMTKNPLLRGVLKAIVEGKESIKHQSCSGLQRGASGHDRRDVPSVAEAVSV